MKTRNYIYAIFFIVFLSGFISYSFMNYEQPQDTPKYVGAEKCAGACHKTESQGNQLEIWKGSKHASAFKNLDTPEADKIAKDKGFTTAAKETPACLKCHTVQADASAFTETFNIQDGVQCETCHGAGSEYKSISIMKDKQKAMDNGLIIHTEKEAFCTQCHNAESPTFKGFDYATYWDKIKHNKAK
ncbi:MAG: cytochrome C554 [Bacteroidetes bacterium]|nr:cytochrome C554 [Bacteroidota bacterium]